MRNLDYDLLRSTSPPGSRVALFPAMSQGIPGTPPPSTLPHPPNHTLSYPTPLSPDSTTPTSSSASPFRESATNASGHNPSRTSSVSSVASVAPGSKISPAPTTVKQKHYWNYYHTNFDMDPSSSSTGGQNSQGSTKPDDIVNTAAGTNFSNPDVQGADAAAPPAPPAPPPVRYTRTGQVIPEGKVMMVNGGCVGEGDWKRSMFAWQFPLEFTNFKIHYQPTVRFNRCLSLFTTSSRIGERFPSCYRQMAFGLGQ